MSSLKCIKAHPFIYLMIPELPKCVKNKRKFDMGALKVDLGLMGRQGNRKYE